MLLGGEVVIVSGPPGSGKSTVSAALARQADKAVHLESDVFFRFIAAGFIAPHLKPAAAQNTAVMDIVVDVAAGYAEAGYVVIWDGIVGPWFLDRVTRRLAARSIFPHYILVRPDREVALQRVRDRDQTNDVSGAEVMYDQMADLGGYEAHVVPSDGSIETVVKTCAARLATGTLRLAADAWIDDQWSVSVKGVLGWDNEFVVLRNGRDEWELPGGRLDAGDESPAHALRREISEELGIDVEVGALLDSWLYEVEGRRVLILTYACAAPKPTDFVVSDEHSAVALLNRQALEAESEAGAFPAGYLASVR